MNYFSFILLFIFYTFNSFAACFPENNLFIPSNTKNKTNITEEDFTKAVDDFYVLYAPIFSDDYGSNLVIESNWSDGTVNAFAQQIGKTWKVSMFGGLARHPETTLDGFRAVICHEIGHHIAGAPRKPGIFGVSWASNEGQSDYFATSKCLSKFFNQKEQLRETFYIYRNYVGNSEDMFAKQKCNETFSKFKDRAICFRSALAGKSLARLLGSLRGNPEVSFSIPDATVVTRTNHNHPAAQCRMDTYFQGSLCINDLDQLADPLDVRVGYCTLIDNFKVGLRPECWYKTSEYEK
jgi:hypothetical protein